MKNYKIWQTTDLDNEIMVEVFNECDICSIQKEFIEKGYFIKHTEIYQYHYFILMALTGRK